MWILLLALGTVSAAGWLRMNDALQDWYWLEQAAKVSPGPRYLIFSGALWGVVALLAAVWVFLKGRGWRWAGMGAVIFLALTYWADRLLLTRSEDGFFNAGFSALVTLAGLAYAALVLQPWRGKE